MSLTILDLYNDGMALLGIYNASVVPQEVRDHVLSDINQALQLMQLAGEDFYARENQSLSLVAGTNEYSLPEIVQQVLDPARLSSNGQTLMGLKTRSDYDKFGQTFLGIFGDVPNGIPLAYFVETLRNDTGADSTQINFYVVPAPSANDTLILNVINDPPCYQASDLAASPPPTPPVPHKYHESVLRPLVRMNVTSCDLYARKQEGYRMIERDYLKALSLLGLADPRPGSPYAVNAELKAEAAPSRANQQQ